jgi:hypothetical protein
MIERFWKCITFCRITASISHKFCEIYSYDSDCNLVVTYSLVRVESLLLLLGKRLILVCVKKLFILFSSLMEFESRSFTVSSNSHNPLVQKGKPQKHFDVKMKFFTLFYTCYTPPVAMRARILLHPK